ncbi:MAG: NAD-dependent epimerase/dehydratase family protein [Polyangiaceae bacterium]|nr:NAD-dependent epimerase/dehydratase family protein [Polyangiaceae bacterium]
MAATYLVTGGAGFIGSALVRRLLATEPGCHVIVLDALTYAGARANLDGVSAELVVGDIRDRALVRSLLDRSRPNLVFHLAAETHVDRSIEDGSPFIATNVAGTLDLYEAIRASRPTEIEKIVHVSTDEVLGPTPPGLRFTEDAPMCASSPYAASKAGAEALAQAFYTTYGLSITIARPTNHYGPRQLAEKLIPLVICRALLNEKLPVYGDGLHQRDWLFVDDGCDALITIARRGAPGRTYHVASGAEHTTLDVVHQVCDALDSLRPAEQSRRSLIAHVADRPGHDRRYGIDARRIEQELGWRATTRLADGMKKTVEHYLEPAVLERAKAHLARRGLAGGDGRR